MKKKPGPLAMWGGMALLALLGGCVDYGNCSNGGDQAAATPVAPAADAAAAPAAADSSMPAAGGAPQATPAVPPPVYPAPSDNWSPPAGAAPAPVVSAPTDVVVPDAQLVAQIKSALAAHSPTRGLHIQISAHEGVVRLTGSVPSSVQIDQVTSVISDVQGVKEVNNLLKVGGH